jgi:DnaJ domain
MEFGQVVRILHDFEQMPGRFPVAMQEPRILFEQAGVVLLLAAGRKPEGWPADAPLEPGLRQAARFFVRTVMLRPGADFYTLLGLKPDFDAEALREHYRLLIRMTHPDFMTSGEPWPDDAAARINQANDVLASAVGRQNYQISWEKTRIRALAMAKPAHGLPPRAIAGAGAQRQRWPAFKVFALSASMALLAVLAVVLSWPTSEVGQLTVAVRARQAVPAVSEPAVDVQAFAVRAVAAPTRPELAQRPKPPASPVKTAVGKPVPVTEMPPAAAAAPAPEPVDLFAAREPAVQSVPLLAPLSAPALVATAPAPPDLPLPVEARQVFLLPEARAAAITLDQVQPLLNNVLQSLQSGQSEQVLQWLEGSSRQGEAATRFAASYKQRLVGLRVTGLGPVRLMSRHAGGQLVVDGVVQLRLQDLRQQSIRQDFRLRAYFAPRHGGPALTRLEAE